VAVLSLPPDIETTWVVMLVPQGRLAVSENRRVPPLIRARRGVFLFIGALLSDSFGIQLSREALGLSTGGLRCKSTMH